MHEQSWIYTKTAYSFLCRLPWVSFWVSWGDNSKVRLMLTSRGKFMNSSMYLSLWLLVEIWSFTRTGYSSLCSLLSPLSSGANGNGFLQSVSFSLQWQLLVMIAWLRLHADFAISTGSTRFLWFGIFMLLGEEMYIFRRLPCVCWGIYGHRCAGLLNCASCIEGATEDNMCMFFPLTFFRSLIYMYFHCWLTWELLCGIILIPLLSRWVRCSFPLSGSLIPDEA